jgi:hypothetical protein
MPEDPIWVTLPISSLHGRGTLAAEIARAEQEFFPRVDQRTLTATIA